MIPTVKVLPAGGGEGFVIINESDFDPKQHVKFEDTHPDAEPDPGADSAPRKRKAPPTD